VNSYKEEGPVKTTLIEGSVRLSTENSLIGSELSLMLQPGQQAILNEDKFVVSRPDITQVVAWKNGRFEFDNTDLTTIMRQISRWYDVDISYKEKPSGKKFGGSISKNLPLSNVLKLLEENGVSFKLE
jgi:ferric-dicitrate binding protein FerR (iron transport regulator)